MEVKQITKEMEAKLRAPLPKGAVKPHPTKIFLSTIKAIYVIERLNEVFGVGSWKLKNEVINGSNKMVIIKAILYIPEYGIELESYGGNDNADNGDAYKGASTDAFTKICSFLEIGIDVFKGLGDTSTPEPKKEIKAPAKTIHKLTLEEETENYTKVENALKTGKFTIEDVKKKYVITDYILNKLIG